MLAFYTFLNSSFYGFKIFWSVIGVLTAVFIMQDFIVTIY